jgi:acylglycerol lipase
MTNPTHELDHATTSLSSGVTAHIWRPKHAAVRAAIVLQHGYCEYAQRYVTSHNNVVGHLVGAGYAVYAMDLWGHGDSPGTRGVVHVGKAVRDHGELRRLARARDPAVSVVLFGHSLGGLVTAGSAVAELAGVRGVVLTGPALPAALPCLGRVVLGAVARALPKTSIPGRANVAGLTRREDEIQKYWDDARCHKDGISFLLAATALDAAQQVAEGVTGWTVPTLVLHGKVDVYCDWKASARFVERIASEDKELVTYEEGRHELLHDLEGDAVLQRILEWIERHV